MNKHMTKVERETEAINAAYEMDRVRASERVFDADSLAAARADFEADAADDVSFADALDEALNKDVPPTTPDTGLGAVLERQLIARREEKRRQQAVAATAMAKARELTASIRCLEDALDGLAISGVA